MTLRTPRRRISPQTKRRCRAIKGFFRRALGSTSQPDLQITSSIAVNVTDIKHKIQGLEKQLNEVSKQCRDINYFQNIPGEEPVSAGVPIELKDEVNQESLSIQLDGIEPQDTYRQSEINYTKELKECDFVPKINEKTGKMKLNDKMYKSYDERIPKSKNKYKCYPNVTADFLKRDSKSEYDNGFTAYSSSSFHSLDQLREIYQNKPGCSGSVEDKRNHVKIEDDDQKDSMDDVINKQNIENYGHLYDAGPEKNAKNPKSKRVTKQLDPDFIEEIIRRQYKPVKMFGRRVSDISQFSVPVCRDRECCQNTDEYVGDDTNPYVCNNGAPHFARYIHHSDHSDMRSVYDARLYNVNRHSRRKHRKIPADAYDSDIYDLVPVKEKSSPKTRRKIFEDNMSPPIIYKEVPPSPRSRRPQFNLKAQQYYSESEDIDNGANTNGSCIPKKIIEMEETGEFAEIYPMHQIREMANNNLIKRHNHPDTQREIGTMSSLHHTDVKLEANKAAVDTSVNNAGMQETNLSANKTDQALCEIKDILQNFLQEIKKESHTDKSEMNSNLNENSNNLSNNIPISPDSGDNFNNYNTVQFPVPPVPFLPPFGNTCCYPVMPMCPANPLNCTNNSYGNPSTGLPHNYVPDPNETNENVYISCAHKNDSADNTFQCETDELIKEIYKFVSRSPQFNRKQDQFAKENDNKRRNMNSSEANVTSRSVGGSKIYKRCDAKVGTSKYNNVSKSCEAIRSHMFTDTSSTITNGSYSDTVLEKHSFPTATQSTIATESSEISEGEKVKKNKFTKVMESLGLYKKNKKDVIEELSESESAIEVEAYEKSSPFRQDVTNYMMHEQEYYRSPPVSPRHDYRDYQQDYRPPYNPNHPYHHHGMPPPVHECGTHRPQYHSGQHPSAPPYCNAYEQGYGQMQPQVPLCLKEVEVKSIACQSERKLSFFKKITKKIQPTDTGRGDGIQKNCSTQTQAAQAKPGLFTWKNPQTKAMDRQLNPLTYGFTTQKKLAEGDTKMRNAVLKKMFYKKNPFSPRNLIIKTLLGKDKSSFGDAPTMYRPRLFV